MPWEKAWGATDGKGKITTKFRFPPTVYYEMQRDLQTARQIEKAVAILRNNGIPSDVVYVSAAGAGCMCGAVGCALWAGVGPP